MALLQTTRSIILNKIHTLENTRLKANYYFATEGFELLYNLHIPKIAGNWDFNLESQITSPNFAINYFGYGNNSLNNEELYGMDYNRVRIRMLQNSTTN